LVDTGLPDFAPANRSVENAEDLRSRAPASGTSGVSRRSAVLRGTHGGMVRHLPWIRATLQTDADDAVLASAADLR